MALNIKDTETAKLAAEVAEMTGDTKTGAVREALREKKERLKMDLGRGKPKRSSLEVLEQEVWPLLPEEALGQSPMSKEDEEELLGFGPEGA